MPNICFFDLSDFDYTVDTPRVAPLGGMQSALSYLAITLANDGHGVTVINRTRDPGYHRGVNCLSIRDLSPRALAECEVAVSIHCEGALLRAIGVSCPLLLWTGHNSDEPTVQKLHDVRERNAWDYFIFKSHSQADEFKRKFQLPENRIAVIGNAISPFVEAQGHTRNFFFDDGRPPKLLFTSTPFRGLKVLLDVFPKLRERFPGCTLDVYSGMRVYQQQDREEFLSLYRRCSASAFIRHFGSVPQPQLAGAFREADILAYPSTYRETACISAMESMASGCMLVSSNLGALPETTAGFAFLEDYNETSMQSRRTFANRYAAKLIESIERAYRAPRSMAEQLRSQMQYARSQYIWTNRAAQFDALLSSVVNRGRLGCGNSEGRPSVSSHAPIRLKCVRVPSGKTLFVNTADRRGRELLESGGNFNPVTQKIWDSLVSTQAWTHVFDVGANYGEMIANTKFPPSATVVAIEPNPNVLPYLRLTLEGLDNVRLHSVAVSNRRGHAGFFADTDWSGTSKIIRRKKSNLCVRVETLDQLVDQKRSELRFAQVLVKVDVEGLERKVLQGASRIFGLAKSAVALIELSHLPSRDRHWLLKRFRVLGYNYSTGCLEEVQCLADEVLKSRGIYRNDVVVCKQNPCSFTLRILQEFNEVVYRCQRAMAKYRRAA